MKLRLRVSDDDQIATATMSDLGFLINIFLMAALMFSVNRGLLMELPATASGESIGISEVVLNIRNDGQIIVDGRPIPISQVGSFAAAARARNPEVPVFVQSDRNVSYGTVVDVMDELVKAGIRDVALPTAPEAEGR